MVIQNKQHEKKIKISFSKQEVSEYLSLLGSEQTYWLLKYVGEKDAFDKRISESIYQDVKNRNNKIRALYEKHFKQ